MSKPRVVLSYSGGADSAICVKLLQEWGFDVITCLLDIGQSESEVKEAGALAGELGVYRHAAPGVKDEFAGGMLARAIAANLERGGLPLTPPLSRPLMAKKCAEIAKEEGAGAVAHGATNRGNDYPRFKRLFNDLDPKLEIIAPIAEPGMAREEEYEYARKHNIPIQTGHETYSIDENIFGRAIDNPSNELEGAGDDAYLWTVAPGEAPDDPFVLDIGFRKGIPLELNKDKKNLYPMIKELNALAGSHGVGRGEAIQLKLTGARFREVFEAPARTVLITAHRELEKAVLNESEQKSKLELEDEWSLLLYEGHWFSQRMAELHEELEKSQERVNGTVKMKLFKGEIEILDVETVQ